jgi:adenylate cyclase
MTEVTDFEAAGLLEGLDGADRAARLALLESLSRDGASLEELTAAVREQRLALLPLQRRLGGRYTGAEVEAESGLPQEVMLRLRRLLGLAEPDSAERVFSDADIEQARSIRLFLDSGFDPEVLADVTRVLGESMSRIAAAVAAAFADTFLQPGDSEEQVAQRFDTLAEQLTPAISPVLTGSFNAHLRESIQRGMISRADLESGQIRSAPEIAVCFADLVGFTRLGGELEVRELGSVAGRLARAARERAVAPVRLVKTIGDAAMLVSPDPAPLIEAALQLIEDAEAAELPSLRAGIAWGPAVQRSGDYFGHSVNLASRVTGVARPGSVLCTQELRDLAGETFEFSYAGRFRLKGVAAQVPLHRVRRRTEAKSDTDGPDPGHPDATSTPSAGRSRKRASS